MINIYPIYLMSGWFLLASANVQYQRKIKLFSSIQFSSIVVVVVVVAIVVVVAEVVVEAAVVVIVLVAVVVVVKSRPGQIKGNWGP